MLVKTYHGIVVRQHLTVQKQLGLLREWYAGSKKALLAELWHLGLEENGGRIPWSVAAICETCKISCLMGKTPYYHTISDKDLSRLHQFGKKILPGIFPRFEELEKTDASEIHAWRLNARRVLTHQNCEQFIFPIADGTVKLSGGDQIVRTSTFIRDNPDRGEEQGNLLGESDGSSAPPFRRELHLPSSR